MNARAIKNHLYEQVARIGRAVANEKRLELIELLCQGERSVEDLAAGIDTSFRLTSAHLKTLRDAQMVKTRRDGKRIFYSIAGPGVADLWVQLRTEAELRLEELQVALADISVNHDVDALDHKALLQKVRSGEVVMIDVRPEEEFAVAHLPLARSIPLKELQQRLAELPSGTPVVAYCRGPFCLLATDAVKLLRRNGFQAMHLPDGVHEWRARGLPVHYPVGNPK